VAWQGKKIFAPLAVLKEQPVGERGLLFSFGSAEFGQKVGIQASYRFIIAFFLNICSCS
jgi:hypothetical protein